MSVAKARGIFILVVVIIAIVGASYLGVTILSSVSAPTFAFYICHYNPAPGAYNGCQSGSLTDNMSSTIVIWGSEGVARANQSVTLVAFGTINQTLATRFIDNYGNINFLLVLTTPFMAGATYYFKLIDGKTMEVSNTLTLIINPLPCPKGQIGTQPNCRFPGGTTTSSGIQPTILFAILIGGMMLARRRLRQ